MCAQAEEIAIKSKMSNLRNVSLELTHFFPGYQNSYLFQELFHFLNRFGVCLLSFKPGRYY